jgi:RNA polymerase primary sigma factor
MSTPTMSPELELADKSRRALEGREGYVPMSRDEEKALGRRARLGDSEAAWTLVMANQNFVRALAVKHRREGIDMDELVSEGLLGLMDAATRFDPERGIKFITYGSWWVKRALLRYLRKVQHAVHVPKYKQFELQEFWRTHGRLSKELCRQPTWDELREATGHSEQNLREFMVLSSSGESLDDELSRSRNELSSAGPGVEDQVMFFDATSRVETVFHVLTEREQLILRLRFGLDDDERWTLAAVGERIGLTKERVRQLEKAACKKLRVAMEDPDFDRPALALELPTAA